MVGMSVLARDLSTKTLISLTLLALFVGCVHAQTIEDGIMLTKGNLFSGNIYSHDSWDHYWQGTLNRANGNLGTVTTQTNTWFANYGVTSRLNVIGMVPYVWTEASQGVLSSQKGFQDITIAAKYSIVDRPLTRVGSLRAIAGVAAAIPLTEYNPDFLPLSIGNQSKRIAARFTLNFQANRGWFLNASGAHTWRSDVTLDRPYYYTDNQLFLTDQVKMPSVFDQVVSAGYLKHGLMTDFSFSQQFTQGGGDIRRQDAPFISNHMNYSKIRAMVMVPVPKLRNLALQFAYTRTLDGRNVGESTTFTTALLYTVHFHGRSPRQ